MRQQLENVNRWLQIIVLITIPVEPKIINNIAIVLWTVSCLFAYNKDRFKQYSFRFVLPFVAYFILLVASIFINPDPTASTGSYLETRISLLILPFFLLVSQPVDFDKAMRWFVIVCCALCLVCLVGAIIKNLDYNQFHNLKTYEINPWFFTYYLYADHVSLH